MDGAGTRALEHKRPKEIVRQDPSPLSIVSVTNATIESPLPSMDELDVYAEATERPEFHVIEVKVNDRTEIRRGIYTSNQTLGRCNGVEEPQSWHEGKLGTDLPQ